ncbi:MAG: acetylglutamate kinase [Vicinamibacterales bacterium]
MSLTLLKLGGELLETAPRLSAMGRTIARAGGRLVVVHGGGREIDVALLAAGIPKRQVDGLRVTDAPTLEIVVGVLAGAVNTRLVAAVNAARGKAVGLTGADAGVTPVRKAPAHRATTGELVDLGLVGEPVRAASPALVTTLTGRGFVPVIACIGAAKDGQLYNVNADTLAGSLAARLGVGRLIIAGGTAGVLDEQGRTIPSLGRADIRALVASGTASAGMVAKLRAAESAARAGVAHVAIIDGRDPKAIGRALDARGLDGVPPGSTRVTS